MRKLAGAAELRAAGGVLGDLDQLVERRGDHQVAADVRGARAADVGAALVGQIGDEVVDLQLADRVLAGLREPGLTLGGAVFLLRLLDRRLDEAEGRRVDLVVGALVVDVAAVGQQSQAALEVDVFAVDRAVRLDRHVELWKLVLALALERAGEADVDVTALVALGVDAEREIQVATVNALQGGVVDDLLRVRVAAATAAAARGEGYRQRQHGAKQGEGAKSAQGKRPPGSRIDWLGTLKARGFTLAPFGSAAGSCRLST